MVEAQIHIQELISKNPIHPSVPTKEYPFEFEISKIKPFYGIENSKEHLTTFYFACNKINHDDALMLQIFPMTLVDQAKYWYKNLK